MWGDDVMLLSMDATGIATVIAVLTDCARSGSARLIDNSRLYTFVVEAGAAHLDVSGRHTTWRLDRDKVVELIGRLRTLQRTDRADIGGVDITAPTDRLLLWRRRGAFQGVDDRIGQAPAAQRLSR